MKAVSFRWGGFCVEKCRILDYNKEKIFRGILCQRKSLQYYFY
uniref:Uncharacterized protein n=1 Tax=Siphoviridae sp. ctuy39 TaxID=2825719 RepID=A0A8S5VEL5_9CAUD|nr:MAG TPA: hypothetical protein [Siphoviridae sp. ctuy39]